MNKQKKLNHKHLKTAIKYFAVTLACYASIIEPAYADPISTAIIAAADFIGALAAGDAVAWTAVAVFALKTAAIAALSYVAQSLLAPKASTPTPQGVSNTIRMGGDLPRAFIAGFYATSGSLVYGGTWGIDVSTNLKNAYLTQVISLADLPVTSLEEIWLGSNKLTWNPGLSPTTAYGVPIIEYRQNGTDNLWVQFYDGTQTTADSWLVSTFGADPEFPYTSTMVGTGCAYIIVTAKFNTQLFSGIPNFKFALKGAKFYDPRADSSVGGSGSQRWVTPSTWAYTDNPQVINYNVFRGVSYAGDWLWGPQGVVAPKLPLSSWTAAMNACDTTLLDAYGATINSYRCGIEITVDMQPVDVIESLNMACNARIAEVGGVYKPLVGAAGASVMTFTDLDILISQPNTFDFFPSQQTLINGLTATYPEPAEGWVQKDAPLRFNATYEAADGKRLVTSINYATVPYQSQVQYLMDSAIEESRKFKKHTLPLPPSFWVLEPNDTITWNSTKNSYTAKAFKVISVLDKGDLEILVVIVETDPADYTFNTSTDYLAQDINPPVVTFPQTLPPDPAMTALMQYQQDLQDVNEALIRLSYALNTGDKTTYNAAAQATSTLQALVDGRNGAIASQITDLRASITTNNDSFSAAILQEAIARVNGDGVSASIVDTLTTTVNGYTAIITQHTSTLNGISASWGVTININGAITGRISLDGLGSTSSLNFLASSFNIYTTAGPFAIFSVSGTTVFINGTLQANAIVANMITAGNIQLTHMSSNSVDTVNLVANAASVGGSATAVSDVPCDASNPASVPATVASFTGTFTGDPIFIWCYLDMSIGGGGNHVFGINVYYNSGLIYSIPQTISILNSSRTPHMVIVPHTPSAGSQNYAVAILSDSAATTAKAGSTMIILQRKR